MASLSDYIEHYLKALLDRAGAGTLEIQRNDLATKLACAPSQINYVLETRFTVEKGYVIESKRGGGGFIRIVKLQFDSPAELLLQLHRGLGGGADQEQAGNAIGRLREERLITDREAALMEAVVDREVLGLGLPYRDQVRGRVLRAMILALLRDTNQ